jgi:hypothetical protein
MKWKEDPSTENQGPGEAANGAGEGRNGAGEGRNPTENQNDSVQAVDNNSRRQENGIGVKASGRSQKIPVT